MFGFSAKILVFTEEKESEIGGRFVTTKLASESPANNNSLQHFAGRWRPLLYYVVYLLNYLSHSLIRFDKFTINQGCGIDDNFNHCDKETNRPICQITEKKTKPCS